MPENIIPWSRAFLGCEEHEEIQRVLDSGWLTTGSLTKRFEETFQEYIGCKHAIAVSSCTAAMHLSLIALGVGSGDEVITTPFTFAATTNVIIHTGATPVFVDIEADTGNLDAHQVENVVRTRYRYDRCRQGLANKETGRILKGVLPVHYGGHPCDMEKLNHLAEEFSIFVVEDAAHALSAELSGVKTGCLGVAGCFSFYPTKPITTGEGGMVTTNDPELAKRVRLLSNHGITRDSWSRYGNDNVWSYEVLMPGFKYNMTDIQAALGIHQLRKLPQFLEAREFLARRYDAGLAGMRGVKTLAIRPGVRHARHLYPILVDPEPAGIGRDKLSLALKARGIGTSVHFIPLHLHPFYQTRYGYKEGDFPVAERLFKRILSLPLYPKMTAEEVDRVVETIAKACGDANVRSW